MSNRSRCCQLCSNTKAVGKYYLSKEESPNPGWWRVCEFCSKMVERLGSRVQFYAYYKPRDPEPLPENVRLCIHKWEKWSLVNEQDNQTGELFDWMRCGKCGFYGKRFYIGQTIMDDLCEEPDIGCSR